MEEPTLNFHTRLKAEQALINEQYLSPHEGQCARTREWRRQKMAIEHADKEEVRLPWIQISSLINNVEENKNKYRYKEDVKMNDNANILNFI
ncbi:hypothetical protein SNEBB_010026 [Seison nebaliae]|nr:hypothetical protein SNEBB_010026 [Seison nebaliae]